LWENYHRLQTEDGTTGKIRQILESIIELTETVGLTPQAFEKQLQSVFLTHVERQTARQLYQKYQQRQKIGLSPETLARDLDDIANFVSIEGVGVETIVDRVNELEVAVTNSPWPSSPAENVLANFRAMIKDVRTQVASLPANIERIKATFNVLQGYYLDQLRQQSETNAAVKKQLTPTTRPLPQFMTAQDRLVSIQSAIAAGTISQRAIDEFLDSAIDDVEREKRTAEPEVVPGVVLEDPAPVVEREPNTPIFSTRVDKEQTPQEPGVPETISNINTSVDRFSLEGVTKFKAEYRPSQEAYADDFQSWVESIQGKHSRNFFRIFNASESVDAFDALKNHSISEIYNIARNPTLKLPPLKIKPEDFQQWSNFMTRIFRISEVMISVSNDATFGELAELGFMYDTITQK